VIACAGGHHRVRIVNVGRMAGESGMMDFDLHSMRRIQYVGQTFPTRSADGAG
jgi:NADPH2:quinone reductase